MMKICFFVASSLLLMCALSSIGWAKPSSELKSAIAEKVTKDLEKSIFKTSSKSGEIGIWIGTYNERTSEKSIETYLGINADRSMIPASLSKLVTLAAVLHEMHPGYKFKTLLLSDADAKVDGSTLLGNLHLKGGGDPSFVSENMWFLVNEFLRSGVTLVDGDIVVDDSRFDTVRFGDDRQEERNDRAYDAPIGAMSMNWNSVNVYVRPGEKAGDKLRVVADVASPYLKIRNETKTVASGRGKNVSVERTTEKGFNGDVVTISGAMALGHPEITVYKNISQPDFWAGYNLLEFLKQRGVVVKGKVRLGKSPESVAILASSESKPLAAVVADMSKWSNNYVAEMLVKNLAAEAGEAPGTMRAGIARVQKYLRQVGLKDSEFEFVNAAGLTRKNRLSPAQIGRVLEFVRSDFTIFPEYLASLPIAGVDGTLRNRMKDSAAERWVRAKTGLLNGVVGLAGYAGRRNGQIISFTFVYNGSGKEDRARALFDQMASRLVED